MAKPTRRAAASREQARVRLRAAQAYIEVAEVVLDDKRLAFPGVAAGLAVLAGIAASDAICARRLGEIHRGEDHRAAAGLLEQATPDGKALAAKLRRLIDVKDQAHYGLVVVAPRTARDAVRWSQHLVDRAREEVER
jgi:hypothetical protein